MFKYKILDEDIFLSIIAILDKLNVNWWIDHGTLLGYARDGHPIKWDKDFDVGTTEDIGALIDVVLPEVRRAFPSAYIDSMADSLKIQFNAGSTDFWSIDIASYKLDGGEAIKFWPDVTHESQIQDLASTTINYLCGRLPLKHRNFFLTYMAKYIYFLGLFMRITFGEKIIYKLLSKISRSLPYVKNSVRADFFFNIKCININNKKFNVPDNYEDYIKFRYGENWKIPNKFWNYITDDGGITDKCG